MMGSEANRIANARVTGLKNARLSKINKFKGCVKQKQLAKFAEEPKQPTLSVTNEELHANHVFVLQIIKPELATMYESRAHMVGQRRQRRPACRARHACAQLSVRICVAHACRFAAHAAQRG